MRSATKRLLAALFVTVFTGTGHLEAVSRFATDHAFSWGSNLGWLNWRGDVEHGPDIDQFLCSGYIHVANIGWINLGSGAPLNGMSYQNNSATDFGVNVGERGDLSGLAYGANIGWINFSPVGQPRVDLATGRLSGFVYGANVGWISLGDPTYTLELDSLGDGTDADHDRIPDAWEIAHTGNLTSLTTNGDLDNDGHSDVEEYLTDTDPTDPHDNLRILKLSLAPNRSSVILRWSTRSTRQYIVETRSGLDNSGQWREAGPGLLTANGPSLSLEVPQLPRDAQRFFRIIAVRPFGP